MTYIMEKGNDFVGPDGESIREVQKRATNWLEDELIYNRKLCTEPQSFKVAIISHESTMRSLFHYIMGFDQKLIYKIGVDNTSISRFIFNILRDVRYSPSLISFLIKASSVILL